MNEARWWKDEHCEIKPDAERGSGQCSIKNAALMFERSFSESVTPREIDRCGEGQATRL
jgi:hypothetical protein